MHLLEIYKALENLNLSYRNIPSTITPSQWLCMTAPNLHDNILTASPVELNFSLTGISVVAAFHSQRLYSRSIAFSVRENEHERGASDTSPEGSDGCLDGGVIGWYAFFMRDVRH